MTYKDKIHHLDNSTELGNLLLMKQEALGGVTIDVVRKYIESQGMK